MKLLPPVFNAGLIGRQVGGSATICLPNEMCVNQRS